jgi:hypothetical protein
VAAAKPASPTKPKSPAPLPPLDDFSGSWLDEDLEQSQPVVASAPRGAKCPSCGAALPAGGVLCVACGYDTRTGAKLETKHVVEAAPTAKQRRAKSELGPMASLVRGTLFSFLGAMLGALIWALIAYMTMFEWAYIAWGLGGLAGLGMMIGNENGDATFAGIIAAFMSLFGIISAKVMIVVFVIAAVVGQMDVDDINVEVSLEDIREEVAMAIVEDKLEREGIELENVTDEQWEKELAAARVELQGLDEDALNQRLEQIEEAQAAQLENELEDEKVADDAEPEDAVAVADQEDVEIPAIAAAPGLMALFFATMFSPIDGLFILLAFFTAYKVGSGDSDD